MNAGTLKSRILCILFVTIIPVLLYLQTLNFGLTHFDDDVIISNNITFLSNIKNADKAFTTSAFITKLSAFYSPLQTLSYMIDIQLSDAKSTWMFHLTNVLLLGLIAITLFLILQRFSIPPVPALFATIIYSVHPLFISSVAWIPARGDLFLTLFSLLSFLNYINYLQRKKVIYLLLSWMEFTLALFSKETAVLLPIIISIYVFTFSDRRFDKKYILSMVLFAMSGIFWYWLRLKAIGGISSPSDNVGFKQFISNLQTIPESLAKFFLPFNIAPIPGFTIFNTIIGLSIIILIVIAFIKIKHLSTQVKIFWLSWYLLLMLPPMIYKNTQIEYLDHRFFLPLIGILIFVMVSIPEKWFEKVKLKFYVVMGIICLILCLVTLIKTTSYSDHITFYNSAVEHNANSFFTYNSRGVIRLGRNNLVGAIDDFNHAIKIIPDKAEVYNNRGLAKVNKNDIQGAFEDYNKAIELHKNYVEAYLNRGMAYLQTTNYNKAIDDYNKVIELCPDLSQVYNNRGSAWGSLGKYQQAIEDFNKAIKIDSNYSEAYYDRGISKYYLKDYKGDLRIVRWL